MQKATQAWLMRMLISQLAITAHGLAQTQKKKRKPIN